MAQLKDSLITGDLRVTGTIYGIGTNLTNIDASQITSGILPVARGGTGLSASPSMLTNLASTTAANVLQANPRPGVTGTLGASNGGTGKTNLKDAANALINALDTGSSNLTANDYVITQYVGGGTTTTTYHRRPASALRVGGLLTPRTLTIGSTGKNFDGTGDVSWTLAEIGAAAAGHNHDSTYVNVSGDTMTGVLTLKGNQYEGNYAMNANNSDIIGLNRLAFADSSDGAREGIDFFRDSTHWDSIWANGGNLYFTPNRENGTNTTAANSNIVLHTGNYTTHLNGTYVNVSGDTMTGFLTLHANPTNNLHAATKQYVDNAFAANDAMIFKGIVNANGDLPATHNVGWTYRVGTAGTYAGIKCEIGDLIICVTDGTSANNAHWVVAQANIDGAVIGPASATSGNIALFDGTTGKLIKNSSYSPSSFATSGHTHTTSLASGGTATVNLAANTTYTLTAGGTSVVFKTPADGNTDTKVNVVARGTTKSYLMADTTAPTSSAAAHTAVAETGIYMTTTAGELNATQYKINEKAYMHYITADDAIGFTFV